ncbi:hypothetical protein CsSME_00003299 [Camellia sinensis var. sinensis]
MGSSESTLSSSQRADDEISTVSSQSEVVDPLLEKLRSLKIVKRSSCFLPGLVLVRDGWSLIAGQIGSRFLEIEDSRLKVMIDRKWNLTARIKVFNLSGLEAQMVFHEVCYLVNQDELSPRCNEGISGRLGLTVKGDNSGIPNGVSNKGCSTLRWRFEAVMWIGGRRKRHVTIRGLSCVEKKVRRCKGVGYIVE